MRYLEFSNQLDEIGFDLVHKHLFSDAEKFSVYWREGLLLIFETFQEGSAIDRCQIYFNLAPLKNTRVHGFSGGVVGNILVGDVTFNPHSPKALECMLEEFDYKGIVLSAWTHQPSFNLLNRLERKEIDYDDWDLLTKERLRTFPSEVAFKMCPQYHSGYNRNPLSYK